MYDSQVARQVYPAPADIVFFSLDSTSLGPLFRTSSGYQADILEQFEISKMVAKMAAGANRKITFEPVGLESHVIPLF